MRRTYITLPNNFTASTVKKYYIYRDDSGYKIDTDLTAGYNDKTKYLYDKEYIGIPETSSSNFKSITTNDGLVLVYSTNLNIAFICDLFAAVIKYNSYSNYDENYKYVDLDAIAKYNKMNYHSVVIENKKININKKLKIDDNTYYASIDMDLPKAYNSNIGGLYKISLDSTSDTTKDTYYDQKSIYIKSKPYFFIGTSYGNISIIEVYDTDNKLLSKDDGKTNRKEDLPYIECSNGTLFYYGDYMKGYTSHEDQYLKITLNINNMEDTILKFI